MLPHAIHKSQARPTPPHPTHKTRTRTSRMQFWEVESNDVDIAVTPASNKAFLHWHVRGRQKLPSSPRRGAPPAEVQVRAARAPTGPA